MLPDNFSGAREVAGYRRRVESAWPGVQVAQVDSAGLPDDPEIGADLSLRAFVRLGGLSPDDVVVQAVLGRVGPNDDLTDVTTVPMAHTGTDGLGEVFEALTPLPVSGFGGVYGSRAATHRLLATDAELGLVAAPYV